MTNKVGLTLTALVALLAAVYWSKRQSVSESHLHSRMENVLESLMRQEKEQQATLGAPRIAIGYGACQDLFIEAKDLFQGEEPPQTPEHYQEVSDWEQLRKMFTFFFQHGAAAE